MRFISFLILLLIIVSCNSSNEAIKGDPQKLYDAAFEEFEDKDYIEAKALFETVILQFPTSELADDSQFYIAMCEYKQKKYILAAYNFNVINRNYPSSEYVKKAIFKAAECYFELSPPFDRDQEYTRKAIQQFQEFQYQFPADSLSGKSDKYIQQLRDKLAHGEYNKAYIYRKLGTPRASLIYYDEVINNFDDTKFYEQAYFGKIEVLVSIRRYDEALGLIDLFKKIFKESKYIDKISVLTDLSRNKKEIKDSKLYNELD